MHALYGKGSLPAMEEMVLARQLKIQELVSHRSLRVQYITETDLLSIDSSWHSFQNVNTPADLLAARALLGRIPPSGKS
jgi:molybdopterin-guanine dinucleotide biosynthesis protein A